MPLVTATLLCLYTTPTWYPICSQEIQTQQFIIAGFHKKGDPKNMRDMCREKRHY